MGHTRVFSLTFKNRLGALEFTGGECGSAAPLTVGHGHTIIIIIIIIIIVIIIIILIIIRPPDLLGSPAGVDRHLRQIVERLELCPSVENMEKRRRGFH